MKYWIPRSSSKKLSSYVFTNNNRFSFSNSYHSKFNNNYQTSLKIMEITLKEASFNTISLICTTITWSSHSKIAHKTKQWWARWRVDKQDKPPLLSSIRKISINHSSYQWNKNSRRENFKPMTRFHKVYRVWWTNKVACIKCSTVQHNFWNLRKKEELKPVEKIETTTQATPD